MLFCSWRRGLPLKFAVNVIINKLKFAVCVIINKRSFESFMCLDGSKSLMLCLKDHESDSSKILPLCLKDKGTAVRVWQFCLKDKGTAVRAWQLCLKDKGTAVRVWQLCLKDKGTAVRVWQLCLKYKMCSFLGRTKSVFSGNEEIKLKSDLLVIRWSRVGEERES